MYQKAHVFDLIHSNNETQDLFRDFFLFINVGSPLVYSGFEYLKTPILIIRGILFVYRAIKFFCRKS